MDHLPSAPMDRWWVMLHSLRTQSFTKATIVSGDSFDGTRPVFTIDVDGDGDVDVVAMAALVDTASWFENGCTAGAGSSTPAPTAGCVWDYSFTEQIITNSADAAAYAFAIDLDNDGDADVMSASELDDTVAWYENDGAQSFAGHVLTTSADGVYSVFATDVDGDGDADVLSASEDSLVALFDNDCTTSSPTATFAPTATPTAEPSLARMLAPLRQRHGAHDAHAAAPAPTHFFARADEPKFGHQLAVMVGRLGLDLPRRYDVVCAAPRAVEAHGRVRTPGSDHDCVWARLRI